MPYPTISEPGPVPAAHGGYWVNDAPGASAGMILIGGGDFAFQVTASEQAPVAPPFSNNHAALVYEFSEPTDLTAGGINDYLVFDVLDVQRLGHVPLSRRRVGLVRHPSTRGQLVDPGRFPR